MQNVEFDILNILEMLKIVITAVITTIFTSIAYTYKVNNEKKFENSFRSLELVYNPILKLIQKQIVPGDGYEGINSNDFEKINEIIQQNAIYVDVKLESFIWEFEETIYHFERNQIIHPIRYPQLMLDEEGKFLDYLIYKNNKLRKDVKLKYDWRKIGFGRLYNYVDRSILMFFRNQKRKHLNGKRKK